MSMIAPGTDLFACAQIVQKGDPDRFMAAMAAPVAARAVLFPIYAFNIEVARAPWVSSEPMIVAMRLQWWIDALDEIAAGGLVRRHEVVTPLALALQGQAIAPLKRVIAARQGDVEKTPFDDAAGLWQYLRDTAGGLAEAAALSLGATGDMTALRDWGQGAGLARYLQAVPDLVARGRRPLPDGRPETLVSMARDAQAKMAGKGALKRGLGPGAAAATEFWQARRLLRTVIQDPDAVAQARLALSDFEKRARLLLF